MDKTIYYMCLWAILLSLMFDLAKPQTQESKINCPENPVHEGRYAGFWDYQRKDKFRCVLKCLDGFKPSGCNVLRKKENGEWNHDIPTCVKATTASLLPSGKTVAVTVGVGLATVFAAPFVLAGAGFTAAGVAAGSIAAGVQGAATASGSVFALCQSAGAAGMAVTTQVGLGSVAGSVAGAVTSYLSCEAE